MRKRDNPAAWNEMLNCMSQGEWKKAKKIAKDNDFYPNDRDEMWRNVWVVTRENGEVLKFRTSKEASKRLGMNQSTFAKAFRTGKPVKGYTIMRLKGDKR